MDAIKITGMEVIDWRYPTSLHSDGSDAVHKVPIGSSCFCPRIMCCVVCVLHHMSASQIQMFFLQHATPYDHCLILVLLSDFYVHNIRVHLSMSFEGSELKLSALLYS